MSTQIRLLAVLALVFMASPANAAAIAQEPWISGNIWVAIAIVGVLVAVILLVAIGSFNLEKRDAKLGRGDDDSGGAGLGMF